MSLEGLGGSSGVIEFSPPPSGLDLLGRTDVTLLQEYDRLRKRGSVQEQVRYFEAVESRKLVAAHAALFEKIKQSEPVVSGKPELEAKDDLEVHQTTVVISQTTTDQNHPIPQSSLVDGAQPNDKNSECSPKQFAHLIIEAATSEWPDNFEQINSKISLAWPDCGLHLHLGDFVEEGKAWFLEQRAIFTSQVMTLKGAVKIIEQLAEQGTTPFLLFKGMQPRTDYQKSIYARILPELKAIIKEISIGENNDLSIALRESGFLPISTKKKTKMPRMLAQIGLFRTGRILLTKDVDADGVTVTKKRNDVERIQLQTLGDKIKTASYEGPELGRKDLLVLMALLVEGSGKNVNEDIRVDEKALCETLFGSGLEDDRSRRSQLHSSINALQKGQLTVVYEADVERRRGKKIRKLVSEKVSIRMVGSLIAHAKFDDAGNELLFVRLNEALPKFFEPGLYFTTSLEKNVEYRDNSYAQLLYLLAGANHKRLVLDKAELHRFCDKSIELNALTRHIKAAAIVVEQTGVIKNFTATKRQFVAMIA